MIILTKNKYEILEIGKELRKETPREKITRRFVINGFVSPGFLITIFPSTPQKSIHVLMLIMTENMFEINDECKVLFYIDNYKQNSTNMISKHIMKYTLSHF